MLGTDKWLAGSTDSAMSGARETEVKKQLDAIFHSAQDIVSRLGWDTWFDFPDHCTERVSSVVLTAIVWSILSCFCAYPFPGALLHPYVAYSIRS